MICLQEMTKKEFSEYKRFLIEDYAQDASRNYCIPLEEARANSVKQINGMLSQGLSTPNQFLYTIQLSKGSTEVEIGYLWLDINEMKQRCILCDIYLHKEFRGKGWGRKTLEVFESQITERGIRKISLHVFANNAVARALYEKLGYKVTGLNLEKWL